MITAKGYDPETGIWNDSLTGDFLWSSVNTREASPDVMTPYTWSMIRHGFEQMIMLPGHLPIGNICGRTYNNASISLTSLRALGPGMSAFSSSSKELYGIDFDASNEWNVPVLPISLQDRILVLRNTLGIMLNVRSALKSIGSFLDTNPAWCEKHHNDLSDMEEKELIRWSNEVLLPHLVQCFWGMVSSAIAQSNVVSKLRTDLPQFVSKDDAEALLSNVSTESELLASLGVVVGLDKLHRGQISREEYVKAYGHRGPHEVELSIPRPAEDPYWIDEQLEALERSPVNVDALFHEQSVRYKVALDSLRKSAPKKLVSFIQRLREAANLTRQREAARSEGMRALWVSRAFALRAGCLCGVGEDIFFLEHGEIVRLLEGDDQSTVSIPVRKIAYQKLATLPQYPTIILGQFDPFAWAADPKRRKDIYDKSGRIKKHFTDQIQGLPGSAGKAEGRVRILSSPEEGQHLLPGEVLVTVTTNVGWTPIFLHAAAVVTDVGAPLSHAAIVARELGIPAVVGCFNATAVLKNGDLVRVDGGQGLVEILASEG